MKTCRKCLIQKDTQDFKKDNRNSDGFGSYCKQCHNRSTRDKYDPDDNRERHKKYAETGIFRTPEYQEKNRIRCREYRRSNPEKASLVSLKWAQRNREKRRAYQEKWRKSNLKQAAANKYLQKWIKNGLMNRGTICEDCNKHGKMEGHHKDYEKPLEVNWLCRRCHMKRHRTV